MKKDILTELDRLNDEIGDVTQVIEKAEQYFKFSEYIQKRHIDSNIVCDISKYAGITQVDASGTITIADSLLQIRYTDKSAKQ